MEASIRSALRHGTAIGAHPGYADRASFSASPTRSPQEIERLVEGADPLPSRRSRRSWARVSAT
jgi:hypothetical protein